MKRLKKENNAGDNTSGATAAAAAAAGSTALPPPGYIAMKHMEVTPAGRIVTLWPNDAAVYAVDVENHGVDMNNNVGATRHGLLSSSSGAMMVSNENGGIVSNSCGSGSSNDGNGHLFHVVEVGGMSTVNGHMDIVTASSSSSSGGSGGSGGSSDIDVMRMKQAIKLPSSSMSSQPLLSDPSIPQLSSSHSELLQQPQPQQQQPQPQPPQPQPLQQPQQQLQQPHQQPQLPPQEMFAPIPHVTHMYTMKP